MVAVENYENSFDWLSFCRLYFEQLTPSSKDLLTFSWLKLKLTQSVINIFGGAFSILTKKALNPT
jgi:hypothetical protein